MKTLLLSVGLLLTTTLSAQIQLDTLAIQDFEAVPMNPVWNYTGILADVQTGYASPTACIPNTPLGINGSTAWHVAAVGGGNPIVFNNMIIPAGYDSIRVNFKLAALNLNGATGGPDNLDYVLVEYSLDNGATYIGRLRLRGSTANNSFWAYDATGLAMVQHLPAVEAVFQPTTVGLQVAEGYSFCEIAFPGNIGQLAMRITPRSSTSTDSWLIDNLVLTGELSCTASSSSITEVVCDTYTAPSGAIYTSSGNYTDIIPNASGCDSTISIDLTVNSVDASVTQTNVITIQANAVGANYQWLDCDNSYAIVPGETSQTFVASANGNYAVAVTANGCTDTSMCVMISNVGIDESELATEVLISPNPFNDKVSVNLGKYYEEVIIRVWAVRGELVREENFYNVDEIEMKLRGDVGMYFMEINASTGESTRIKILKAESIGE